MKNKILFGLKSFILVLLCYHSFLFAEGNVATLRPSITKPSNLGKSIPATCRYGDSLIMAVINKNDDARYTESIVTPEAMFISLMMAPIINNDNTGYTASIINAKTLKEVKKIQIKPNAPFYVYPKNTIEKIIPLEDAETTEEIKYFIAIDQNRLMLWRNENKDNELTCVVLKKIKGHMDRPITDRVLGITSHSDQKRIKDVIQLKNGNIAVLIGNQVEIWGPVQGQQQECERREQGEWEHIDTIEVETNHTALHEASENTLVIQDDHDLFDVWKWCNEDGANRWEQLLSSKEKRAHNPVGYPSKRTMSLLSSGNMAISQPTTMQIVQPGKHHTYDDVVFRFDTVGRHNRPYESMIKIIELRDGKLLLCPKGDGNINQKNPLELWKHQAYSHPSWTQVLALKMPEKFTENPIVINIFQMQSHGIVALVADQLETTPSKWVRWDLDHDWTQPSEPIRDYRDYGRSSLVEQGLSGHTKKL